MGRSLTNAMVNLGIDSPVEEALYEVSHAHVHVYIHVATSPAPICNTYVTGNTLSLLLCMSNSSTQ